MVTETAIICVFFRDEGMGSKAMIIRLLRVPLLWSTLCHWRRLMFILEFVRVAVMATANILLLGCIFVFFFGSVLWESVVFSAARLPEIPLDFGGLASSCYTVYLMLIGDDWHTHTSAIFAGLDETSQRVGFLLLFFMQFVGGQVLLNMLGAVVLESWRMCCTTEKNLSAAYTAKPVKIKTARFSEEVPWLAMSLMQWTSADISLEQNCIRVDGHGDPIHVDYTNICAAQVLQREEHMMGLQYDTSSAHVLVRSEDQVILIDAGGADVAALWAQLINAIAKRSRAEFALEVFLDPKQFSSKETSLDISHACLSRRCTAIDVLVQGCDDFPLSLHDCQAISPDPMPATHSDTSISQRLPIPPSSGNEMSCRTNTTPRATPRKISDKSPRHTPRAMRDEAAALPSEAESDKHMLIASVEMFRGIRTIDVNALAGKMRIMTAHAGSTIIHEGQLGTTMVRILRGVATFYEQRPGAGRNETPRAVRTLEKGAIIGDRELFADSCGGYFMWGSVVADMETKYVVLGKEDLVSLLVSDSLRATLLDNAAWLGTSVAWLQPSSATPVDHPVETSTPILADTDLSERSEYTERSQPSKERRSRPERSRDKSRRSTSIGSEKPPRARQPSQANIETTSSKSAKFHGQIAEKRPTRKDGISQKAHAGERNGGATSHAKTDTDRNGVTLSSNGPAPVYFSAGPALLTGNSRPPATPPPQVRAPGGDQEATPVVNKENAVAYLNNNVVLPPGAKMKLASQIKVHGQEDLANSPPDSQPETPTSLQDQDLPDLWT